MLAIRDLSFFYGKIQALNHLNLDLREGEIHAVIGANGAGKSTMMNCIAGQLTPQQGEILLNGIDIRKYRYDNYLALFSVVFQDFKLLSQPLGQNVAAAEDYDRTRAEECLRMVGLGGRLRHMPSELSGGEQQRVAIARAMAHRPRIIFADEPTAELDSAMGAEVARLFKEMCEKEKVTIVMTTHDVGLMGAGDTVLELESGCLKEGGSAMEERHSMEEGHSMEERHSMEEGSSKAEIPSREG